MKCMNLTQWRLIKLALRLYCAIEMISEQNTERQAGRRPTSVHSARMKTLLIFIWNYSVDCVLHTMEWAEQSTLISGPNWLSHAHSTVNIICDIHRIVIISFANSIYPHLPLPATRRLGYLRYLFVPMENVRDFDFLWKIQRTIENRIRTDLCL